MEEKKWGRTRIKQPVKFRASRLTEFGPISKYPSNIKIINDCRMEIVHNKGTIYVSKGGKILLKVSRIPVSRLHENKTIDVSLEHVTSRHLKWR